MALSISSCHIIAGRYVLVGDEATQSLSLELLAYRGHTSPVSGPVLKNTSFFPW